MEVEVFKTNVSDCDLARRICEAIHVRYSGYKANFDLDDCDRILRIASSSMLIDSTCLIEFLKTMACEAEILPEGNAHI